MSKEIHEVEEKESIVKTFKEMNKVGLIYYTLAFLVLFTTVFVFRSETLNRDISELGLTVFAQGIGWLYFIVNGFGLATILIKPLDKVQKVTLKILSLTNLILSVIVLFQLIPDAVTSGLPFVNNFQKGYLGAGFWIILLLHVAATAYFWIEFIKKRIKKHKEHQQKQEIKELKKTQKQQ